MQDSVFNLTDMDASPPPHGAVAVARGVLRLFARNDIFAATEISLRNHRRTDLMGIDARGQIIIAEIKTARGDLLVMASGPNIWTIATGFTGPYLPGSMSPCWSAMYFSRSGAG